MYSDVNFDGATITLGGNITTAGTGTAGDATQRGDVDFDGNVVIDGAITIDTDISNTANDGIIDFGTNTINAAASGTNSLTLCLLYTSPSPRDATLSRMPSSA